MTRSKATGTRFESDVVTYLRNLGGLDVERLTLSGSADVGDIVVKERGLITIIEAKATQRLDLAGWWKQATTEARNYELSRKLEPGTAYPIIVHKRRNASIADAWVTLSLSEFFSEEK